MRLCIGGSSTMRWIFERAFDVYKEIDEHAEFHYDFPGSGAGIQGVLCGTYHIAAVSRELYKQEIRYGLCATTIAMDGIMLIVKDSFPVDDITLEQAAAIFTGEISNWSRVGGPDLPIVPVKNKPWSDTDRAFLELVLMRVYGDDARIRCDGIQTMGNRGMMRAVSRNRNSIGYAPLSKLHSLPDECLKALNINGVAFTHENILNRKYPITRPLNMVTVGEPSSEAVLFIDFLRSPAGQHIVDFFWYLPVR